MNRELALALLKEPGFRQRFELSIDDSTATPAFGAEADERFRVLLDCMQRAGGRPKLTIRQSWPPRFDCPEPGRLALILPWEYGSIPLGWRTAIRQSVDEVWAPSTFVRETYVRDGVPSHKVFVVPLGVNPERFRPGIQPYDFTSDPLTSALHSHAFKFLFVGGTLWRKGIDILLDAFSRAFSSKDDVALIIKDFGVSSFYAGQGYKSLIEQCQANAAAAKIAYLASDLSDDQVASLYAACDCLVHPYRGEGYGLPIAEAMACGKPAILTGFGAALDFANDENSFLVPATLVQRNQKLVGEFETVNFPHIAEPDRDALVDLLRFVASHPAEATEKGRRAAQDMANGHTWAHAARSALPRLDALLA